MVVTVQVWRAEWRGDAGRGPDGRRPSHGPGALAVVPGAPGQRAHCARTALHFLHCGCFSRKWTSYLHIFHVSFIIYVVNFNSTFFNLFN